MKLVEMRSRLVVISEQCSALINEIDSELKRKADLGRATYNANLTPSGVRNSELKEENEEKDEKEEPSPHTPYKKKEQEEKLEKKAKNNITDQNAGARARLETEEPAAPRTAFAKPTLEEVAAYVKAKNYAFDPEAFWNFYESKGWKVGRVPMKSWKAACVTWQKSCERNAMSAAARQAHIDAKMAEREAQRQAHIDAKMAEREAARQAHIDAKIEERGESRRGGYDDGDYIPDRGAKAIIARMLAEFDAKKAGKSHV